MTSEVTITVSGPVGSGKSAMCKEIEILCRALGVRCEWEGGQQERNISGGDSHDELAMYAPTVKIVEVLAQPAGSGGVVSRYGADHWDRNFCHQSAIGALRFLADHDRPGGGSQSFNSEHLMQIANDLDSSAKAIERLAAAPASPQGWLPIESAPRDGTRVLLAMGGIAVIGKWDDAYANEVTSVTHWQPLPAPPSSGDGRGVQS